MTEWEFVAKALWKLLDDIDTLGDSMKPDRTPYFERVNRIVDRRHALLSSDGHELSLPAQIDDRGAVRYGRGAGGGGGSVGVSGGSASVGTVVAASGPGAGNAAGTRKFKMGDRVFHRRADMFGEVLSLFVDGHVLIRYNGEVMSLFAKETISYDDVSRMTTAKIPGHELVFASEVAR